MPGWASRSTSILRRTPGKTEIMAAEETTDLFPGDVVKVEVVSPRSARGGDIGQHLLMW